MRSLVLSTIAALALIVPAASHPAATVTKTVKITATAFSPASVTIATGDAVKWTNVDTKNHQVVANNGAFASPILVPGRSWTHPFGTSGTYRYHDALHPALTGKVVVTGPPPAVSIGAGTPILVYGQATHIRGQISSGQAGETVVLFAQQYGAPSQVEAGRALTGTSGVWDIAVHPKVSFSLVRGRGFVKVQAARSMAGRKVYVQRLTRFREWVKIKRVILGPFSSRRFRFHPARGRYVLRAYMTVNQAGPGYLDGISRTIVYRQR